MRNNTPIILGSQSPRRRELLKSAGFEFTTLSANIDETFPDNMPLNEVAAYIAENKATYFIPEIKSETVITADTVVISNNQILGKPQDKKEAFHMLRLLSGQDHLVTTGVCILRKELDGKLIKKTFSDTTKVWFRDLTNPEIEYYIDKYQPFDKAGAYGIQEWIGMIGITKIEGSYFNVMGLPVNLIYEALSELNPGRV